MLCLRCKEDLPESDFNVASRNPKRNYLQSYCKNCMREFGRQHRKENLEHYRARSRRQNASPMRRLKQLLNANTVDRHELDFEWAWNKLEQLDFKCELTGISFTWESRQPTALSIDRIDPSKGYTKENVRFVCWWLNAAMGNWGYERLKELIKESGIAS